MKKIYRKPVTKVIVIEDSLLNVTSPGQSEVKLPFGLDEIEDEGYGE